ncbi:MAG: TlpA disulfide reductase family protein [Lachnospiraceae bacterium]
MKYKLLKTLLLTTVITFTSAFASGCALLDPDFLEEDEEDEDDDDEEDEDDDRDDEDDDEDEDDDRDDEDDDRNDEDDDDDDDDDAVRGKNDFTPADSMFAFGQAKDLYGNTVTDDIFSEYDITVINIWGTFCGPCIGELPELAAWNDSLPEHACIIGIVCDIQSEDDTEYIDEALYLLDDAGADYINLIPNEGLYAILNNTEYVPTTIFVDSEGNQIGEAIVGADVEQYKDVVNDYLSSIDYE